VLNIPLTLESNDILRFKPFTDLHINICRLFSDSEREVTRKPSDQVAMEICDMYWLFSNSYETYIKETCHIRGMRAAILYYRKIRSAFLSHRLFHTLDIFIWHIALGARHAFTTYSKMCVCTRSCTILTFMQRDSNGQVVIVL